MDVVKLLGGTILGLEGRLAERRERDKLDVLSRSGTDFYSLFIGLSRSKHFLCLKVFIFKWIEDFELNAESRALNVSDKLLFILAFRRMINLDEWGGLIILGFQ